MDGPGGNQPVSPPIVAPASSLVGWTQFIYALHAFSLLTGIIGAATVVGAYAPIVGESHPNCVWTTFCNH